MDEVRLVVALFAVVAYLDLHLWFRLIVLDDSRVFALLFFFEEFRSIQSSRLIETDVAVIEEERVAVE